MADASRTIDPNNICFDISDVDGYNMYGLMGCGNAGSVVLMIIFQIVVTLIMLNLFVAIIIEVKLIYIIRGSRILVKKKMQKLSNLTLKHSKMDGKNLTGRARDLYIAGISLNSCVFYHYPWE